MLSNFDEAVFRCIDENSRLHIREAMRCYDAGAYRSAIVAAYIAVSFDLIEKLRILAASGDMEAKRLLDELEILERKRISNDPAAIPGLLKFERNLPVVFRDKFEFFGVIAYDDIQRLVVDRNRCAHPTFLQGEEPYHPSAESARLHIRNALDLVLTQEPRQGKAALDYLRGIITSSNFPKDEADVRVRLEVSPLKRARPALIRAFIDDVAFGAATKGHVYSSLGSGVKSAEAVVSMHPGIALERYSRNISKLLLSHDADVLRAGAVMALRLPDVGNLIDEASRPAIRDFIKAPLRTSKANAVQRALKIGWLRDFAADEAKTLTSSEIRAARLPPAPEVVDRAVNIIDSISSVEGANEIFSDLLGIMKFVSTEQIRIILKNTRTGILDSQSVFGFNAVLQVMASENPIGKDGLQKILAEFKIPEPKWLDPTDL